jgi:hypothetical protein
MAETKSQEILLGTPGNVTNIDLESRQCPECGRRTQEDFCAVHGDVEPESNFYVYVRLKGSNVRLDSGHVREITGKKTEELRGLPRNDLRNYLSQKLSSVDIRVIGFKTEGTFYVNKIDVYH